MLKTSIGSVLWASFVNPEEKRCESHGCQFDSDITNATVASAMKLHTCSRFLNWAFKNVYNTWHGPEGQISEESECVYPESEKLLTCVSIR